MPPKTISKLLDLDLGLFFKELLCGIELELHTKLIDSHPFCQKAFIKLENFGELQLQSLGLWHLAACTDSHSCTGIFDIRWCEEINEKLHN